MIVAPGWADIVSNWANHPAAIANIATNGPVTTATLTAGNRRYFCKAAPADQREAVQALRVEAAASTIHRQAAAPFHGLLEGHAWNVLVFDHIDGHHPSLYPPTTGLALADRIADLIKTPVDPTPSPSLPTIADRFNTTASWSQLLENHPGLIDSSARKFLVGGHQDRMALIEGHHVAHGDLHRGNILVDGQDLTIVDWGWATRAAPWFDQALLGIQLIAAEASINRVTRRLHTSHIGHPCSAEELAAFAVEMSRYWISRMVIDPAGQHLWRLVQAAGRLSQELGAPAFLTANSEPLSIRQ